MKIIGWGLGGCVLLLFVLMLFDKGISNNSSQDKEALVVASQPKSDQAIRDDFAKNRESILSEAKSALEANDLQRVVDITKEHLISDDLEVVRLHDGAREQLAALKAATLAEGQKRSLIAKIEESINRIVSSSENIGGMPKEDLSSRIDDFDSVADLLRQTSVHQLTEKEKSEIGTLKKKLSGVQAKDFPVLRRAIAKRLAERMWEHDVDVRSLGQGGAIIEHVGGHFVLRSNIKEAFEASHEVVRKFRFKQARYQWSKHSGEFTYYKIDSPKDSIIVVE